MKLLAISMVCAAVLASGAAQAADIDGDWQFQSVNATTIKLQKMPTITFKDGRTSGFGGCNGFNGSFDRRGDALTFGPVASTRMACQPPAGDWENRIFGVLDKTRFALLSG